MKRMIIALALLGLIIGTAFASSCFAESAIENTCAALNECIREDEGEAILAQRIDEAVSTWNSNKHTVYVVMIQEDFAEIEKFMAELESHSGYNDFLLISRLCAETELLLRNKKEEIKVSFENVF